MFEGFRLSTIDTAQASIRVRHGRCEIFYPEAMEEYVRCLHNPETIHATCEDYQPAATLDFEIV